MNADERDDDRNGEPGVAGDRPLAGADGALATEVITASLPPSELPAGGWERLRASVAAGGGATEAAGPDAGGAVPAGGPTGRSSARSDRTPADASLPDHAGPGAATVQPPPAARRPVGYLAALALALVCLAGVGVWGYQRGAEAGRLRDDQRILAYWMSNPGMELTALQPAEGIATSRLGVLCVLPDGRALVLQPTPAEPGTTYVVVGWGAGGLRELARGRENMLQFEVNGIEVVELRTARGDEFQTLALARLD